MPLADRFPQRADPRSRSVFRAALLHGANGGALDMFGRWKIRFAGAKIGQVNSLGTEFLGRREHGGSRRDGNAVYSVR